MKFQRWFRENSKILMVVIMSLLLLAFLVGDVVQSMTSNANMRNEVRGEAFGVSYRVSDVQRVYADTSVLEQMGVRRLDVPDEEMFLLYRESEELGVKLSREEVANTLAKQGVDRTALAQLAHKLTRSPDALLDAFARQVALQQAVVLQGDAIHASQPRLERAFRDQRQEIVLKVSAIEAQAFLDGVPEPTEEELLKFFDERKDRLTEHGESELKFGYRYEDRVQLEYLTVDPKKIESKIRVSEREAREFYEANRSKYVKSVPKPTTQSTQSTQPRPPEFERVQLSFEDAQDQVKRDRRLEKAIGEAQKLVNEIERAARTPWLNSPPGPDHYLTPPPAEAIRSFEDLAREYSRKYEVEYHKTELLDLDGLAALPGIGGTRLGALGPRMTIFPQLATKVRGLAELAPREDVAGLNLLEPSPVMMSYAGGSRGPYQAYVFRVMAIEKSSPPASMEPVRAKVIEDFKLSRAFAQAEEQARKLADRAREVGLDQAVAEAEELKQLLTGATSRSATTRPDGKPALKIDYVQRLGPSTPSQKITRSTAFVPPLGMVGGQIKKVFDLAAADAATQPGRKVHLAPLPGTQKWGVIEVVELKPLYAGEFEQQKPAVRQSLLRTDWGDFQELYYDALNVRARAQFKPAPSRPASEEE
ncbi:MAG: hypothetical protein CHACPFDD_01621 [Phycisphaerae bacterium]|nr:hypothetical protein [Phycisphaerae bacterium]